MNTGETIGADIAAAEPIIGALVKSLNPVIGQGVSLGLKLLSVAEPAVYNAIVAELQGTPLTDQQKADKADGIARLESPEQYFT